MAPTIIRFCSFACYHVSLTLPPTERRGKHQAAEHSGRAMPPWADTSAIVALYVEAARLTATTGTQWDVDHIVPLNNPRVCGLHVAHNLQLLTHRENQRKGGRFPAHR